MIIVRATLGDNELNLGVAKDDFDLEIWLEFHATLLGILGITDIHVIHYPSPLIPGTHDELIQKMIHELFT